jgi:hypothetical protein
LPEVQDTPLSVDLSHLLVAFTIELDNVFEERLAATLPERPYRVTSLVMWSNLLRFVGAGITVADLPGATGLPKGHVLSMLGGVERWRYVDVAPAGGGEPPATRRDGYGSARALRGEWVVRPTAAGRAGSDLWPPILAEIEGRWGARFGTEPVAELRAACDRLLDGPARQLPEYLPIVRGAGGMRSELGSAGPRPSEPVPLSASLAQVLLTYTLAFEREAPLALPLAETVVRALGDTAVDVRALPAAAGVSGEAVAMALTVLRKDGHVEGTTQVRLTAGGRAARDAAQVAHASTERRLRERHGAEALDRLRAAASAVLGQRHGGRSRLALGLDPPASGWRAGGRYRAHTDAVLADPIAHLPRHPLVLHRGGWPDGS